MTNAGAGGAEADDATAVAPGDAVAATLAALAEQVEDLSRVVARQAATLDRLVEDGRAQQSGRGADLPLLVDLFAIYSDATRCALAAPDDTDRAAFTAVAAGIERLIVGRGGAVVSPRAGDDFDARTMEAVDVRPADTDTVGRTVAEAVAPGLSVVGRSVRPAAVIVYR